MNIPGSATPRRRPSGALIASVAVHVVIGALFVQALVLPRPFFDLFGRERRAPVPPAERIGFLRLPHAERAGEPASGGPGGQPTRRRSTPPPRLVAPTSVPVRLPPAPATVRPEESQGPSSGPLVGGRGALRGVQPRYNDPRVWAPSGALVVAPRTAAEALDSVIAGDIAAHNDSVRVARGNARAPGDWTVERGGHKWGIDSKFIRLGPVSIPTAVLALLPLNVTGNPTTMERERTLSARHDEIFAQAQRGINEADFQRAVREIRQRKERERRERLAARRDSTVQRTP